MSEVEAPRGRGRPRRVPAQRSSHQLQVRVTDDELAMLKELAAKHHDSLADWLRLAAFLGTLKANEIYAAREARDRSKKT